MTILSADIGGTNCRFKLFTDKLCGLETRIFPSSSIKDFQEFMKSMLENWAEARSADIVSIAAAGPVHENRISMTNAAFTIDANELREIFPKVYLINDFIANGLACLKDKELIPILHGKHSSKNGRVVIIGAGTGLGTAYSIQDTGIYPCEAGHCTFPFTSDEAEFQHFFEKRFGNYVSYENILAGNGFKTFYQFVTGKSKEPEEFIKEEGFAESEFCKMYAKWTGRYCRQLALAFLPEKIIITGGIAGKTPALIQHPAFCEEFLNDSGSLACTQDISIFLNKKLENGLLGAAIAGKEYF